MNIKVPNIDYSEAIKSSGLFKKLGFVLFAIAVYRLGTYIPVPGINSAVLEQIFEQHRGGILGIFDMFSGGALMRMSIFTLGVMPYISASIIMTLMQSSFDSLKALKEQGTQGRKKIQQYTRYLTIVLGLFQSYGISNGILNLSDTVDPTLGSVAFFQISAVITMTSGTIFLMWLGEQITENGFGSGISIIIFSGIVANLPFAIFNTFELGRTGALSAIAIISIIFLPSLLLPQKITLLGGKLMGYWSQYCLKIILSTNIIIKGKDNMIKDMQSGSVIYDLAAVQGGNTAYTEANKIIDKNGVKIMGENNILNKLPISASSLYAKNVFNFIDNLFDKKDKKININLEDEIIEKTLIK